MNIYSIRMNNIHNKNYLLFINKNYLFVCNTKQLQRSCIKKKIPYQSLKQRKLKKIPTTVFQTGKTNSLSLLTFCVCHVDNFFPSFPLFLTTSLLLLFIAPFPYCF